MAELTPTELEEITERVELPQVAKDALEQKPLCGGRKEVVWATGMPGKRTTAWCAEPLCINTGSCTGAKFVAHTVQHENDGTPRRVEQREIVPIARMCARLVTGKDDPRSDREIMAYAMAVYQRMAKAVRGGNWRE